MSHTKEPWHVFSSNKIVEIKNMQNNAVVGWTGFDSCRVDEDQEANARRIVACVNACEGSPTEALEEMQRRSLTFGQLAFLYSELQEAVKDMPTGDELRAAKSSFELVVRQRDELLAALKQISGASMAAVGFRDLQTVARKAIASANGGAA